jgi:hypothetical protein
MELNDWTHKLRGIYDGASDRYRKGWRGAEKFFSPEETAFLASVGLKPINVYDYVEDFANSGEPDWDTFLLVAAARRDFFLYKQHREPAVREIQESELPARDAELDGFPWLPRIIVKARNFLEGSLCRDIMYGCGGDRRFLKNHGVHPADFLRVVWAAEGDDAKVAAFVRQSADALGS